MTSRQPYETALVGEIICSHRCDPWKQEALLCLPSLCLLMQTTCRGRGRLGAHHSSVDSPPPAPPKTFHSVLSPCITNTGRTHQCGVCVCDSGVRGESGQFVFKQVYLLDDITRGQGVFVSQKALIKNRSRPAVLLVVLEKNLVEQILHDCGLINMIINTLSLTYNKGKCLLLTIHQNQST